jgi:phosphoribosylaminoimidazole-succinocarboxamide synthase
MTNTAVLKTNLSTYPVRRGKVRDVYDLGKALLIVATDRISAFDWVLPAGIPDKGWVLTQLSLFWFRMLDVPNHLLTAELAEMSLPSDVTSQGLEGRSMLVRKARVVPVECVVRGYLSGSGWKEYSRSGTVCGIPLPAGLVENAKLREPIFTPATKEEHGHDVNISFEQMVECIGQSSANELRRLSLQVYQRAADYAAQRGIIIADTKFEWGWFEDELILIDEVLTPDSSRFWPADGYQPGQTQPSFDKQFVRDWLETTGWDKESPPTELPPHIVERTREKYIEAFERITGKAFPWK